MFSKKAQTDVKKSAHKILDPKKDTATRFKHLKFLLGMFCVFENISYIVLVKFGTYRRFVINNIWWLARNFFLLQTTATKMNLNIYSKATTAVSIKYFMKVSLVLKPIWNKEVDNEFFYFL